MSKLSSFGVLALSKVLPKHKVDPKIQNKKYPEWALKEGKLSIKILLYKNADLISFKDYVKEFFEQELKKGGLVK